MEIEFRSSGRGGGELSSALIRSFLIVIFLSAGCRLLCFRGMRTKVVHGIENHERCDEVVQPCSQITQPSVETTAAETGVSCFAPLKKRILITLYLGLSLVNT